MYSAQCVIFTMCSAVVCSDVQCSVWCIGAWRILRECSSLPLTGDLASPVEERGGWGGVKLTMWSLADRRVGVKHPTPSKFQLAYTKISRKHTCIHNMYANRQDPLDIVARDTNHLPIYLPFSLLNHKHTSLVNGSTVLSKTCASHLDASEIPR